MTCRRIGIVGQLWAGLYTHLTRTIEMQISTGPTGWELIQNRESLLWSTAEKSVQRLEVESVNEYNFGTGDGELYCCRKNLKQIPQTTTS